MEMATALLIGATITNGMTTGALFDQTFKQLPARHRVGAGAYTAYLQAADLANGLLWYPIMGVCTVLSTAAAVVTGLLDIPTVPEVVALVTMAVGITTFLASASRAARTLQSLRHRGRAVAPALVRFARVTAAGATAAGATLAATVWALVLAMNP